VRRIDEFLTFKTKDAIALDMVRHARDIGIDFGCVGADALNIPLFFHLEHKATRQV
jgi:hypothetical protein